MSSHVILSVHEHHRTHRTFPMARPKCLMRDFTNLNRIYKAHQTNVWWIMKVFRLHCIHCFCVYQDDQWHWAPISQKSSWADNPNLVNIHKKYWTSQVTIILEKATGTHFSIKIMSYHRRIFFIKIRLSHNHLCLYSGNSHTVLVITITPSHQKDKHVFADWCKNTNDIFDNYVWSSSHMVPGLPFSKCLGQALWKMVFILKQAFGES